MNTVIPVLAALAGALVGGLIAELRAILEIRRDVRRITNKVLFNLLDLRHLVRFGHHAALLREIAPTVAGHPSFAGSEAEVREYLVTAPGMREAMGKLAQSSANPALADQYETAVDALASVDPLLAFQLSGRAAAMIRVQEKMTEMFDLLTRHQTPNDTAEVEPLREKIKDAINDFVHDDALNTLEKDIIAVAARLGWWVRWRVKRVLRRSGGGLTENDQEQFARFLTAITRDLEEPSGATTENRSAPTSQ